MKSIREKIKFATLLTMFTFATAPMVAEAESKLESLRSGVPISDNNTPVPVNVVLQPEDGFDTAWDSQPPSIPHEIHEDKVTLSENTCMNCHSKENYKKEEAVKIGKSHYYDREDNKLEQLSARRYLCVQCHTTQLDVGALIENTFQSEE